jgi:hypothetical protein
METILSKCNVLDCGDASGLRYQVWGEAADLFDTSRVASEFVCSTDDRGKAQKIANLLNVLSMPKDKQLETLKRIKFALCYDGGERIAIPEVR